MTLAWLLLLTGLTISAVAIYYSVVGLTAIFSAAAIPIVIMGVSLEVAKLVCATWIKQYWTQVPVLMKTYMVTAVVLLMFITSMGIFGFLSKAHSDQTLVSGDVGSKIAIYDEKIRTARDNIDAGRKQLAQMDAAVDQVMGRSTDEKGADKAVAIRNSQKRDRAAVARDIESNQRIIATLNDEAAPIRAKVREVEAEVGPIKYIAAFLYGVAPDSTMLEKAVTWIIIIIVIVFDPLAVIMLLAAQMTFGWNRQNSKNKQDPQAADSNSTVDPTKTLFGILGDKIQEQVDRLKSRFGLDAKVNPDVLPEVPEHILTNIPRGSEYVVADSPAMEPVLEPVEAPWVETRNIDEDTDVVETSNWSDADYNHLLTEILETREAATPVMDEEPVKQVQSRFIGFAVPMSTPYLQLKTDIVKDTVEEESVEEEIVTKPMAVSRSMAKFEFDEDEESVPETTWTPATKHDADQAVQQLKDVGYLTDLGKVNPNYVANEDGVEPEKLNTEVPEAVPGRNRGRIYTDALQADNDQAQTGRASNTDFGNTFPAIPEKGDIYLRTDFLPNRLFKYNGFKWIEVDKDATDVYAYEDEYIKHLIEEITEGRYDLEMLTETEQNQIADYLKRIGINVQ